MIENERQKTILAILREEGHISVKEIARRLHYSEMTIRRDLLALEGAGLLERCHGGATELSGARSPIAVRAYAHDESKKKLAKKAAAYLHDGMTVFLDSSATSPYLIPYLAEHRRIRAVTNSIHCLLLLSEYHIPTYLLGGAYNEADQCTEGPATDAAARELHVDLAVLSSQSVDEDGLVTDTEERQTAVRREILKNAEKTILLFDQSKLGRRDLFTLCRREDVTEMITV